MEAIDHISYIYLNRLISNMFPYDDAVIYHQHRIHVMMIHYIVPAAIAPGTYLRLSSLNTIIRYLPGLIWL